MRTSIFPASTTMDLTGYPTPALAAAWSMRLKHYRPEMIDAYVAGVRKVVEAAGEL